MAKANRSIESASRSFERHAERIMRMEVKGQDASKAIALRDRAEQKLRRWMKEADFLRGPVNRAQSTEKRVQLMLTATIKPPQETDRQRKTREKEKRQREAAHAIRSKTLASAAVDFDPRIATADRELHIDALGNANRARSLTYTALFGRRSVDATTTRVLACTAFDDIWHAAHAGEFPEPKFEPQVDSSRSDRTHQESRARAKMLLQKFHTAMGPYFYSIVEQRIVRNMSYGALARLLMIQPKALPGKFAQAVDVIAEVLRLDALPDRPGRIRAFRSDRPEQSDNTEPSQGS
jgi:hypothetical protein